AGTSISLFVVTALLSGTDIPTSSTVNIDGSQSWDVSIDREDNATLLVERQWFTTPVLPDATHTVSITNFPRNFSLNYALVRPGSNTPLDGELLIVDDEDPAIGYMGTWDQNTGTIVIPVAGPINLLEFLPVNGATRSALSIIDTLQVAEFNFTEPISPTAVALRQGNGADSEDMIHSPVPGGQSLLDISPFPPPNDTDTSVELIPHRLEPQRMSVPNHELIVIPEVEVPQQSPLQQLIRALRLSQDRQSSAVFAGSTNLLTDDEFIDVAVTPFSVPLDRVPEENIHHINARLQQLQAIAMDIQREIAETQSIPSDVPVQLAPPTESPREATSAHGWIY
ncbi:hypothetical protein C0991_003419, partial [Blastosporella zonata]